MNNKETKTPFLDFYKKYHNKQMPNAGLCGNFIDNKEILLFSPDECIFTLSTFWANTGDSYFSRYRFNTLRQTIVLFCAAINNEL